MNSERIKIIRAFDETNGTGILDVSHAGSVVEKARRMAQTDKMVAISMKGITSMSIPVATKLYQDILKERGIAKKVAFVGSSPYIQQIMRKGIVVAIKDEL